MPIHIFHHATRKSYEGEKDGKSETSSWFGWHLGAGFGLLFGCARLFGGKTGQIGWYIRLKIGNPGAVGVVEVEPGEIIPYDPSIDAVPISTGMLVSDSIEKGGKKNYSVSLTPGATYFVLFWCT